MGQKILRLTAVVLVVTALTFLMVDLLPGDAAHELAGMEASREDVQALREELGLTDNVAVRYFRWLSGVMRGDMGVSYTTREKVSEAILARLPVTLELILSAQFLALCLALPAGIVCAYRPRDQNRPPDKHPGFRG